MICSATEDYASEEGEPSLSRVGTVVEIGGQDELKQPEKNSHWLFPGPSDTCYYRVLGYQLRRPVCSRH